MLVIMPRPVYTVLYNHGTNDYTSFREAVKRARAMVKAHGSASIYAREKRIRKFERLKEDFGHGSGYRTVGRVIEVEIV
jgi:ribonuclease HII